MGTPLRPIADADALATTRASWHALAEHVVAAARHRATGRIGLRATDGGFGAPPFGDPATTIRVDGDRLVVTGPDGERAVEVTTLAAAAEAVGIEPGAPTGVYTAVTPLEPARPLLIDPGAAATLAAWFRFGTDVLDAIRRDATADEAATEVTLWPEHFDLGLDLGDESRDARGTLGASPGDGYHAEPYVYAMPWSRDATDAFWDEPGFAGATLRYPDLLAADDPAALARDFLHRARTVLARRAGD